MKIRFLLLLLFVFIAQQSTAAVVLVTGGFKNLGLTLTQELHSAGHDVIATGRDLKSAEESGLKNGPKMTLLEMDLTNYDSFQKVIDYIDKTYGKLDAVVHNAANIIVAPADALSAKELEIATKTNFIGPVELTNKLMPLLERGSSVKNDGLPSRIIYISSSAALLKTPDFAAYASTKAAAESHFLTRSAELYSRAPKDTGPLVTVSIMRLAFISSAYEPKFEIIPREGANAEAEAEKQRDFMSILRRNSPTTDRAVAASLNALIASRSAPTLMNVGIDAKLLSVISVLPTGFQNFCTDFLKRILVGVSG